MTRRIVSDPAVMLGKPCIAGTRITVEHLLREMAAGASVDQVLEDYPSVTREDLAAALAFAAEAVEKERVYEASVRR